MKKQKLKKFYEHVKVSTYNEPTLWNINKKNSSMLLNAVCLCRYASPDLSAKHMAQRLNKYAKKRQDMIHFSVSAVVDFMHIVATPL